jgi:hypothetical protein
MPLTQLALRNIFAFKVHSPLFLLFYRTILTPTYHLVHPKTSQTIPRPKTMATLEAAPPADNLSQRPSLTTPPPIIYMIRHGEKPPKINDEDQNGLSAMGLRRSQALPQVFGKGSIYDIGYIIAEKPKKGE